MSGSCLVASSLLQSAGRWNRAGEASASEERSKRQNERKYWVVAVVKVTPPMGCVKYKAQHVVLAVRIPLFKRFECYRMKNNGAFAVDFAKLPHAARVTVWLICTV